MIYEEKTFAAHFNDIVILQTKFKLKGLLSLNYFMCIMECETFIVPLQRGRKEFLYRTQHDRYLL